MKLSSVQTRKCELHQHCRRFYRPHLAQYNRSQIEHSYQDWDEFALYSYLCQGISSRFPLFTVSTLKNFNQINFNSTWKQWTKKQCLRCPLLISPQGYTKPPATPSNTCSNKNGQFDKISSNQVNVPPFTYSCIIQRRRIKHVNACKSIWNPKRASTIHKALTIVPRYPHMTVALRCRDRIPHQHYNGIPVISSPMHIGMVMTVIKPKLLIKKKYM